MSFLPTIAVLCQVRSCSGRLCALGPVASLFLSSKRTDAMNDIRALYAARKAATVATSAAVVVQDEANGLVRMENVTGFRDARRVPARSRQMIIYNERRG